MEVKVQGMPVPADRYSDIFDLHRGHCERLLYSTNPPQGLLGSSLARNTCYQTLYNADSDMVSKSQTIRSRCQASYLNA